MRAPRGVAAGTAAERPAVDALQCARTHEPVRPAYARIALSTRGGSDAVHPSDPPVSTAWQGV